ncbi:MAG TPA: N-acetylmuramoyl-L-alanine amidase [Parafilimonas sp.]|nr:N-acetylmuramoyl-L-alanine amidase [Parafilimonas sp.]
MLQNVLVYNFKVIVCAAVLLSYYVIALRNKRFHQYNRFYILSAVLVSTILPLLHFEWFPLSSKSAQAIQLFKIIEGTGGEEVGAAGNGSFNWQRIAVYMFLSVGSFLLLMLVFQLMRLLRLKNKFPVTRMHAFDLVITDLQQAPFSFFRNIFWREDISLNEETGQQIFNHELIHVKQKHSWDKLGLEILLCFYWLNPFFWWLRKELNLVHEFIADEKAVANNDTHSFSRMLLTTACHKFDFSPAHSFSCSPIKRRLIMLTTSRKTSFSYLRRIMFLPLIGLIICLFAFTVRKQSADSSTQNVSNKHFVLVVDAGHGGKDLGAVGNDLSEKDVTLKIAEEIKSLSSDYGVDVVLTRDKDAFMSPADKSTFANAQHADAFVSIHVNAALESQEERSGFEVVVSRNSAKAFSSRLFGSAIIQSLQTDFTIEPSLQQRTKGVWILDNSILPAALVECGYLTNKEDANLLKDNSNIASIARAILNGVALYANNKNSISQKDIIHASDTTPVQHSSDSAMALPLYVLDGKIVTKKDVDKIDPSSVEQINVLKGKEAADKYGEKGKGGVVEITLKKN